MRAAYSLAVSRVQSANWSQRGAECVLCACVCVCVFVCVCMCVFVHLCGSQGKSEENLDLSNNGRGGTGHVYVSLWCVGGWVCVSVCVWDYPTTVDSYTRTRTHTKPTTHSFSYPHTHAHNLLWLWYHGLITNLLILARRRNGSRKVSY